MGGGGGGVKECGLCVCMCVGADGLDGIYDSYRFFVVCVCFGVFCVSEVERVRPSVTDTTDGYKRNNAMDDDMVRNKMNSPETEGISWARWHSVSPLRYPQFLVASLHTV